MDYANVGVYGCVYNSTVQTLSNCPTKSAFIMYVLYPITKNVFGTADQTGPYANITRILIDITPAIYIQMISSDANNVFTCYGWNKLTTTVVS